MKKFTATFNAQNGFCHSIELQAKNRQQAQQFAQAYKRRNGYLGKTTIGLVKDPDRIKKAVIDSLRKNGVSESFIEKNFIFATI